MSWKRHENSQGPGLFAYFTSTSKTSEFHQTALTLSYCVMLQIPMFSAH